MNDLAMNTESDLAFQEEAIPASTEELQNLLQTMTQREKPVSQEEMMQAAALLQEIVSSSSPAVEVSKHLDEIDNLMPAIIDLNIQQARKDGRPDLVSGLGELKKNISLQKSIQKGAYQQNQKQGNHVAYSSEVFAGKVAVFEPSTGEVRNSERIKLIKEGLYSTGSLMTEKEILKERPGLAIFSNAFLDPQLMDMMAKFSIARVPIILDIDESFETQFLSRVNKADANLQLFDRKLTASLFLANLITTASESFAESLKASNYPAMVIQNSWSVANPYWTEKKETNAPTVQLGWFGNPENLDDLAAIRRPLVRILREFDDKVRLVIVGNQNAYRMFDLIPDSLKTYIPYIAQEEIPYILNQVDILLMPLWKANVANINSDDLFMYAGIKKIPWVASPSNVSMKWTKGGMLCSTLDEWHTNLRYLILDKELRFALGSDGFNKAASREIRTNIGAWNQAFNLVLSFQQPKRMIN
jgi:hypothetical protein